MVERLTKDITDQFFPLLCQVASDLSTDESVVNPMHMMRVMKSESDVRSTAHNDNPKSLPPEQRYNASGLIQFMPATLKGLGYFDGHARFRMLSPEQQLTWVKKYYWPYRGFLHTVGGLYTATFMPALVKHANDPDYVLVASAPAPHPVYAWAYGPNSVFDANKDHQITVRELEDMVNRACKGERWEQLAARLEGYLLSQQPKIDEPPVTKPEVEDVDIELTSEADFDCK